MESIVDAAGPRILIKPPEGVSFRVPHTPTPRGGGTSEDKATPASGIDDIPIGYKDSTFDLPSWLCWLWKRKWRKQAEMQNLEATNFRMQLQRSKLVSSVSGRASFGVVAPFSTSEAGSGLFTTIRHVFASGWLSFAVCSHHSWHSFASRSVAGSYCNKAVFYMHRFEPLQSWRLGWTCYVGPSGSCFSQSS